jgi:hypothetical protein
MDLRFNRLLINGVVKLVLDEQKAQTILRYVPYEQGFHFFTPDGHYTGETARTLCFFQQDMQRLDIECFQFHFFRGDFQKWLRTTIGDEDLAQEIDEVDRHASDEVLRQHLVDIVQKRILQLKSFAP